MCNSHFFDIYIKDVPDRTDCVFEFIFQRLIIFYVFDYLSVCIKIELLTILFRWVSDFTESLLIGEMFSVILSEFIL